MRTSIKTRPSRTRAITGTSAERRRAARSSAGADPRSATAQDPSSKPGREPPPTGVRSSSSDDFEPRRRPPCPAARRAAGRAPRGARRARGAGAAPGARAPPDPPAGIRASSRAPPARACRAGAPARPGRAAARRGERDRPSTIPAWGPPSSLSPEKQTRSAPSRRRGRRVALRRQAMRREIDQRAAAEILDHRHALRAAELRQLGQRHLGRESAQLEVAAVDLEQQRGARAERALVVGQVRAVGGAHLDQLHPRPLEDLRHAERAADLDQLAARDDHLAAARERSEREEERCGVVVDGERRLRRRRAARAWRRPPHRDRRAAAGELELEVGVAARRPPRPRPPRRRPAGRGPDSCAAPPRSRSRRAPGAPAPAPRPPPPPRRSQLRLPGRRALGLPGQPLPLRLPARGGPPRAGPRPPGPGAARPRRRASRSTAGKRPARVLLDLFLRIHDLVPGLWRFCRVRISGYPERLRLRRAERAAGAARSSRADDLASRTVKRLPVRVNVFNNEFGTLECVPVRPASARRPLDPS